MLAYARAGRVRARLEELERNQAWLARKLEVDISTVYRWLIGERPIPDKRLPRIAEILGMAVEELQPSDNREPVAA